MKLISNNTDKTHLNQLKELLDLKPKAAIFVSPFLANKIFSLLREFDFTGVEKFILITTFKTNDKEQLTKPFQLRDLYTFFDENHPNIKVLIHVNNSLHGKLYFFNFQVEQQLLVSSANFTRNGLENNSEWGLLVSDEETIHQAKEEVFADLDQEQLTKLQVTKACDQAKWYIEKNPQWVKKEEPVELNILKYVTASEDSTNTDPKYYLKPLGHTEDRIWKDDQRDFSDKYQKQHFSSSRQPIRVRKGDYLITSAIGAGSLLSYFRVTGTPEWVTDAELAKRPRLERWRWYLESENMSRDFGAKWWEFDLLRNELSDEFNNLYPDVCVTKAGGFNLKSINYGSDKLELTPEFGKFLIDKIKKTKM